MVTISDLVAASAALHDRVDLSDKELDHQLRDHAAILRQSIATRDLSSVANDDTLLDHFSPTKDSLTYLFLLRLQFQTLQETSGDALPADFLPPGKLWSRAACFLDGFDCVQVRYAGLEFRQLIEIVAEASQAVSKPVLAALLIRNAVLRLDPTSAVLTSTHLLLVRLCLHARAYTCVLPVLDKHISHLPVQTKHTSSKSKPILCARKGSSSSIISEASGLSAKLTYKDYLRYFLYGGMVYMALKNWRKASHFLGIVISMPTVGAISMVMVEAYKKWVLVGLLEMGKLCPPPSITAPNVAKMYQSLARPYITLANAFERGDVTSFNADVSAAQEIWSRDNNAGLVSQLQHAFSKHAVMRIKTTFGALTLAELAQQAPSLPQEDRATESAIVSLIMSGDIDATLVHPPNHAGPAMLRFPATSSTPPLSHELDMQAQFREEKQLLESLMGNLKQINHRLGLSDEVVDHLQKGQGWAGSGDTHRGSGENAATEMEEDIMGDMS